MQLGRARCWAPQLLLTRWGSQAVLPNWMVLLSGLRVQAELQAGLHSQMGPQAVPRSWLRATGWASWSDRPISVLCFWARPGWAHGLAGASSCSLQLGGARNCTTWSGSPCLGSLPRRGLRQHSAIGRAMGWDMLQGGAVSWAPWLWCRVVPQAAFFRLSSYVGPEAMLNSWAGMQAWLHAQVGL